jgi:hypothetical protein
MTAHAMPAQFIPAASPGVALIAFQALLEHSQPFRRSWIALSGAPECLYAGHPVTTIADFIAADLGNA